MHLSLSLLKIELIIESDVMANRSLEYFLFRHITFTE